MSGKLEKLTELLSEGTVKFNEPMAAHTTFKIGGPADAYVQTQSAEEILKVLNFATENEIPCYVCGNGSNMLVADDGVEGIVLSLKPSSSKPEQEILDDGSIKVKVFAGDMISVFSRDMAKAGYAGTEPLAGIPGSVGGAVAMNAGAYGGEIKDIIYSADVIVKNEATGTYEQKTLLKDELDLGYRKSEVLRCGMIVAYATFVLKKGNAEESLAMIADFNGRRRDKQPLDLPSAGSTFKRPEGYFAGKLIEDSGLRGYCVGNAGVSTKHCGFVVNNGGATAAEVKQVIDDVRQIVLNKFGVTLEPEVRLIGRF